jgi:hypothetical protein
MKLRWLLSSVAVTGLTAAVLAQLREAKKPDSCSYSAAFYSSATAMTGSPELTVFPLDGKAFAMPLPFPLGAFTYSPDGKALYAVAGLDPRNPRGPGGLLRIDFNPIHVSPVPGSLALGVSRLAVSVHQDKIIISGAYQPGNDVTCGVFELSVPSGNVRQILQQPDCDAASSWAYLSLSPDGERAVATHNHRLELIDLVHGTIKSVEDGLLMASWSPDGKWLAALENGGRGRTILMDASNFERRRFLETSDVKWSPDSRYLLGWKKLDFCGPDFGTLQMVNIENGKIITIKSSRCRVNQTTTGWLSTEIVTRPGT